MSPASRRSRVHGDSRPPPTLPPAWHTLSVPEVLARLQVAPRDGLSMADAAQRLVRDGPNVVPEHQRRGAVRMALDQFTDLMVLVLLGAAGLAAVLGEPHDAIAILAIVVLNGVLGFVQEFRAAKALSALQAMAAPTARVRRAGTIHTVAATQLVPGDVVLLDAGMRVPADLRLLDAAQLDVDEAMLTGESEAVAKEVAAIATPGVALGDRRNLAFQGTMIRRGRGTGVVVATGRHTELGRIASLVSSIGETATPLQRRLAALGRRLALVVFVLCSLVFAIGLWRHEPALPMFMTALGLAVAAIPEALPAVVTVLLAFGARRLARQGALIRRLPAVETLGSVTCICSDKTGTLTENRMRVDAVVVDGEQWRSVPPAADTPSTVQPLVEVMTHCTDAMSTGNGTVTGESTEVALLEAARDAGWPATPANEVPPRLAELPFSSDRARMTTVHARGHGVRACTKGAPERVLPLCNRRLSAHGVVPLDTESVLREAQTMAASGLRVLAFAHRDLDGVPAVLEVAESQLCFLGLVGLLDPPRATACRAIDACRTAGIQVKMITGDHPGTARAIAERLGLLPAGAPDGVVTGAQLTAMDDGALTTAVARAVVFARVAPEDKDRIVAALQARGELVAMTGDGVNDAPALQRADIGVAMGRSGTDAARDAAHLVLLDDDFSTIVSAVAEGRRIHDNVRKFVRFVLTGNAGEIWVLFLAPLLGLPLPLLPIQLLWINLVTDGLPGLAFAAEPPERDVMHRAPRPPGASLFADGVGTHIAWVGLLLGGITVLVQWLAWRADNPHWQSMTFTVLTLSQLAHAFVVRSDRAPLWHIGLTTNRPLLGAVVLTGTLHLAVLYVPALQVVFRTHALTGRELGWCVAAALVVVVAVELVKGIARRRRPIPLTA